MCSETDQYLIGLIPLIIYIFWPTKFAKNGVTWMLFTSFQIFIEKFDVSSILPIMAILSLKIDDKNSLTWSSPQLPILHYNSYSSSVNGFHACGRLPCLLTSFFFTIMIKLFTTMDLAGFPTGETASTFQDMHKIRRLMGKSKSRWTAFCWIIRFRVGASIKLLSPD